MKIVAILGSPHGMHGATGTLLSGVLQGVAEATVETFSLSEMTVQPCRGCDACHRGGVCPIRDDFNTIKSAMEAADGLVLASPNYIVSVSAQMKAFFDRCCGLLHLQAIEGKYAAAVVTSGGPGADEVEHYMLRFLRSLGYATVGSVSAFGFQMLNEAMRAPHLATAAELGARLADAITTRATFPEQEAERQAFHDRMRQLVTMQKEHWPYEYEYWASRGRM